MTWGSLPQGALCLFSGAALGLVFLLMKLARRLLALGRLAVGLMDLLFCLLCGVTAFLCALVLDHGRLRLFQAALQLLGGWAAVIALDPFVEGAAAFCRRAARQIARGVRRPARFIRGKLAKKFPQRRAKAPKRKKPAAKGKKPKKPLEKLT